MTDRSFVRANDESRERLAGLVATLTPARQEIDLGEGWTVASALGHMGFWDNWQAERLTEMMAGRWSAADASVMAAEHLANEALHPYWAGVAAGDVAGLALAAAERVDALAARAPDELVEALTGSPSEYLLRRHRHRGEHLDHIERALAAAETAPGQKPDRSYVERNRESLEALRELAGGLTPADLALETEPGGWTVGHALGHMAFWDRYMAARWREALASGRDRPLDLVQAPADMLNDALAPVWQVMAERAPEAVVAEVLAAAGEIDGLVATLPDSIPVAAIQASWPRQLDRSLHRRDHVAAVERALAAK
jgi:hypothetical protein